MFARHHHFDVDDPKNITGMQKMTGGSSQFKAGASATNFNQQEMSKVKQKQIRYKGDTKMQERDTFQWISNKQDMSRLSNSVNKTPIFFNDPRKSGQSFNRSLDMKRSS